MPERGPGPRGESRRGVVQADGGTPGSKAAAIADRTALAGIAASPAEGAAKRWPSVEADRIDRALDDLTDIGVGIDAPPALVLAVNAALGEPDPGVREEAIALLGDRGEGAQVGVLRRALSDEHPRVRAAAVRAIGRAAARATPLAPPQAIGRPGDRMAAHESALAMALADADPRVRAAAVDALADLAGDSATAALRRAATDTDAEVREAALERLDERGRLPGGP